MRTQLSDEIGAKLGRIGLTEGIQEENDLWPQSE
jgi:hypothetical protein